MWRSITVLNYTYYPLRTVEGGCRKYVEKSIEEILPAVSTTSSDLGPGLGQHGAWTLANPRQHRVVSDFGDFISHHHAVSVGSGAAITPLVSCVLAGPKCWLTNYPRKLTTAYKINTISYREYDPIVFSQKKIHRKSAITALVILKIYRSSNSIRYM